VKGNGLPILPGFGRVVGGLAPPFPHDNPWHIETRLGSRQLKEATIQLVQVATVLHRKDKYIIRAMLRTYFKPLFDFLEVFSVLSMSYSRVAAVRE
jgi:hypothetical protein